MILPTDLPQSTREAELMGEIITLQAQRSKLRLALNEAADLHAHLLFPVALDRVPWWLFWRRWSNEASAQAHLAEIQSEKADEWYQLIAETR